MKNKFHYTIPFIGGQEIVFSLTIYTYYVETIGWQHSDRQGKYMISYPMSLVPSSLLAISPSQHCMPALPMAYVIDALNQFATG